MRNLIEKPHVKKFLNRGDRLFSIASLMSVPLLVSLCGFWYCQRAPIPKLTNPSTIVVLPGQTAHLDTYYTVSFEAKRALYNMWLEDSKGRMVYEYKPVQISSSSFTFGNLNVQFPTELAPGNYSLHAELMYPLNPFKTATVSAELLHLRVVTRMGSV